MTGDSPASLTTGTPCTPRHGPHRDSIITACRDKCVPPKYAAGDLGKAESVCLDRCVAKYMEMHDTVGKILNEMHAAPGAQPGAIE